MLNLAIAVDSILELILAIDSIWVTAVRKPIFTLVPTLRHLRRKLFSLHLFDVLVNLMSDINIRLFVLTNIKDVILLE